MQAMLQAPAFLYRLELGNGGSSDPVALTDHEIAARLSYLLWGSAPDDALLKAADDGTLKTVAGREAQARRMLKDARARRAWVAFTRQWLDSARLLDVQKTQKDPATFPDWSEQMRADVVSAQDRFVESAAFDGDGRLESLLTSTRHFVNPLLATKLYGVGAPAGSDFAGVDVPNRPGLLTTAGFLAGEAHPVNPSPVLRGVFIMDRLLCSPPPNPPANVNTTIATGANAPKTNRERYAAHATSASCAACHTAIDGFGFPFESFDAIGRFRTSDGGSAVDTAGVVKGAGNVDGDVANVGELMTKLSQSSNVHACVTTQMFRYAFGKVEEDRDRCAIQTLDGGFAAGKNDVKELLVAVVKSSVFALRAVAP
jgi:hypothetical protein